MENPDEIENNNNPDNSQKESINLTFKTIIFDNGEKFQGSIISKNSENGPIQIKEGFGKFIYKNGSRIEGEFKDDKLNGFGIYYDDKNNVIYKGYWKDNLFDGIGMYFFLDGSKFEGEFMQGRKNGLGTIIFKDGSKYIGNFKNDLKEGYAIHYNTKNDKYEGQWSNDLINGIGTCYYSNGDKYTGQWKNGLRDGYGIYEYENGYLNKGYFKNGNYVEEVKNAGSKNNNCFII